MKYILTLLAIIASTINTTQAQQPLTKPVEILGTTVVEVNAKPFMGYNWFHFNGGRNSAPEDCLGVLFTIWNTSLVQVI